MIFIVETSPVPIYQRHATAIAETLIQHGHTVHFIDATPFSNSDYINTINGIEYDYYISTNELNKLQAYSNDIECFIFEKIAGKFIFVHHDNLCSCINDIDLIHKKLNAFSNHAIRSFHFCIENRNIKLLNSLSISQAYKIHHVTEFNMPVRHDNFEYGISFIGHLMTTTKLYPIETIDYGRLAMATAWNKLNQLNFNIENFFFNNFEINPLLAKQLGKEKIYPKEVYFYHFISSLNKLSSAFRGDIFSNIKSHHIEIIGGDLSYGRISDPLLKFNVPNIKYHNATTNYADTKLIYNKTKISLNISSLQFDNALNPRVFDVFASGGFLITDRLPDLAEIFQDSDEISFNSVEELQFKLDYFSQNENHKKYIDLKEHFKNQIITKYTYNHLIESIMKKV
jgi:hypothetical protein